MITRSYIYIHHAKNQFPEVFTLLLLPVLLLNLHTIVDLSEYSATPVMNKEDSWVDLFFSHIPPEFVNDMKGDQHFQPFRPDDENWKLGGLADKTRWVDGNKIQVFWLVRNRRKTYIGKAVS